MQHLAECSDLGSRDAGSAFSRVDAGSRIAGHVVFIDSQKLQPGLGCANRFLHVSRDVGLFVPVVFLEEAMTDIKRKSRAEINDKARIELFCIRNLLQ